MPPRARYRYETSDLLPRWQRICLTLNLELVRKTVRRHITLFVLFIKFTNLPEPESAGVWVRHPSSLGWGGEGINMATSDGASSISVTVRVRPFTIREAAQLTKTNDGPLFLGDGSLAGAPTPKLTQKGIRSIIKVVDDRCL